MLRTRQVATILIASVATLYGIAVYAVPALSDPGDSSCISALRPQIAKGVNPAGDRWSIVGTLESDANCRGWLVGAEFRPSGTSAGSWAGAWGVPAGGHLSDGFTIGGQDESEGGVRAFSAVVGARIEAVVLQTAAGQRFKVPARLPSKGLRRKYVWLRNMRVVMAFYPLGSHVKTVKLLDAKGGTVYTARGSEGIFQGPL